MITRIAHALAFLSLGLLAIPSGLCCARAETAPAARKAPACPHCRPPASLPVQLGSLPTGQRCCCQATVATPVSRENTEKPPQHELIGTLAAPLNWRVARAAELPAELLAQADPGPSLQSLYCIWRK